MQGVFYKHIIVLISVAGQVKPPGFLSKFPCRKFWAGTPRGGLLLPFVNRHLNINKTNSYNLIIKAVL